MNTYKMPNTDMEVSGIIYGCMNIGGTWETSSVTDEDKKAALDAIFTAYDQGINCFDHADIYHFGKSETVFAEALRARPGFRDKIFLQSKCGIRFQGVPNENSPARYDFSFDHIISSVEAILKRLNTDYLDILLLHRPDPLMEPTEVARAFDKLFSEGKVRYFGVSNHTVSQIELLRQFVQQPLIVNQLEISLRHHHLINEGLIANQTGGTHALATGILDYCRINNISIQAWSPLAGGIFTNPPQNASNPIKAAAHLVSQIAEYKQTTKEAIVLGWLMRHPAKIQPVIGTSNPKRIQSCCQADSVHITREEWYSLFTAVRGGAVP